MRRCCATADHWHSTVNKATVVSWWMRRYMKSLYFDFHNGLYNTKTYRDLTACSKITSE